MNKKLTGKVIKLTGGFYYVEAANKIYECRARGIFRKEGKLSPYVGDNVEISVIQDSTGTIDKILKRRNSITRPPLANIDTLVIVSSTIEPLPNYLITDKMIAVAESKGIEPVVVVSKVDLDTDKEFLNTYKKTNIQTIEFSSKTKEGKKEILSLIKNKTTAFIGNTGVGKSTLINTLFPSLNLETGTISEKLGRGKHTTRTVELFKIDNGYIADTPGFSSVDLIQYEIINQEDLQFCFREFKDYIGSCKFTSCKHLKEPGCAITNAVKKGQISKNRHKSYETMYGELKKINPWELK